MPANLVMGFNDSLFREEFNHHYLNLTSKNIISGI